MTEPAREQFASVGLLYAYLQRIHVFTRTLTMLRPGHGSDIETAHLTGALDNVGNAIRSFNYEDGMDAAQRKTLEQMAVQVREWIERCWRQPPEPPEVKIARIASDAYFDDYLNQARVQLGEHYDESYADYCRQRILVLKSAIRFVNSIVGRTADGTGVTPEETAQVNQRYDATVLHDAENLDRDFALIAAGLG